MSIKNIYLIKASFRRIVILWEIRIVRVCDFITKFYRYASLVSRDNE